MVQSTFTYIIWSTFVVLCISDQCYTLSEEEQAKKFLEKFNTKAPIYMNYWQKCEWTYQTNLTEYNEELAVGARSKWQSFLESMSEEANQYDLSLLTSDTKRQMKKIQLVQLPTEDREELNEILAKMAEIYAATKFCKSSRGNETCLMLEPELQGIMATSRDPEKLKWTWDGWHTKVGRELRPLYVRYIQLENKFARLNGANDYGEMWRNKYETPGLEKEVDKLWNELKPYYLNLHAYIRRKLYEQYGPKYIQLTGPIPQQFLGDIWGRFWTYIYPIVVPFKDTASVDPTPQLIQQNYTPKKMFQLADSFYQSLGLYSLPSTFWKNSVIEKNSNVDMMCHATAWDMFDGKDFRIKMCTEVDFKYLRTVHHETGHTQYHMSYAHLPLVYRDGANDGFHEAIGEVMAMSVSTPTHLHKIGLLPTMNTDFKTDINFLLYESLRALSSLPFHLVMDKYRWRLFRGDFSDPKEWNDQFWKLNRDFMGVVPPVTRNPYLDMDVTTIYHVSNDYDMIRYFIRTILQYQFSEALCDEAGFDGALHRCDVDGSKEAGQLLRKMMELGSSKPWPEALEVMTGQKNMTTKSLKRYFKPLYDWLRMTNKQNGDCIGWDEDCINVI